MAWFLYDNGLRYESVNMRQPICNDADFLLLAIFFGARHVDEPKKLYRIGVFSTNFKITFTTKTRQSVRKVAGWLGWLLGGCSNVHLLSIKKVLFVVETLFLSSIVYQSLHL